MRAVGALSGATWVLLGEGAGGLGESVRVLPLPAPLAAALPRMFITKAVGASEGTLTAVSLTFGLGFRFELE